MLHRYLNSAAAKALFRAGDIQAAERMAARFTKDGDQPNNLTDMQAMWYEIEAGTAHARLGQHGMVRPLHMCGTQHDHCMAHCKPGPGLEVVRVTGQKVLSIMQCARFSTTNPSYIVDFWDYHTELNLGSIVHDSMNTLQVKYWKQLQALKRLLAVRAHFDDFVEDQFDFHSYCVRKMTLRAYVAMLRMEDRLHRNALFVKVMLHIGCWGMSC